MEMRSAKQIAANKLDLDVVRLVYQIERFVDRYGDDDVAEIARRLNAHRGRIRRHLHRADREATS